MAESEECQLRGDVFSAKISGISGHRAQMWGLPMMMYKVMLAGLYAAAARTMVTAGSPAIFNSALMLSSVSLAMTSSDASRLPVVTVTSTYATAHTSGKPNWFQRRTTERGKHLSLRRVLSSRGVANASVGRGSGPQVSYRAGGAVPHDDHPPRVWT